MHAGEAQQQWHGHLSDSAAHQLRTATAWMSTCAWTVTMGTWRRPQLATAQVWLPAACEIRQVSPHDPPKRYCMASSVSVALRLTCDVSSMAIIAWLSVSLQFPD